MPPKKKNKPTEDSKTGTNGQQFEQTTVGGTNSSSEKPVEPLKTQPAVTPTQTQKPTEKGQKSVELQPQSQTSKAPTSSVIKLDESAGQKKVLSLQSQIKSQQELRELRAFKFGGSETAVSIQDASKLIAERARKFGGIAPLTSQDKKKRLEKFGGVDKEEEKELKKKRSQKFGNKQGEEQPQPQLSKEDQELVEARKKKFMTVVPPPEKKQKTGQ